MNSSSSPRKSRSRCGSISSICSTVSYELRTGSGIGVFAPQYGARRGFFVGLSQKL